MKVLTRWEIENYLLLPDALEIVLSDKAFRSMRDMHAMLEDIFPKAEDVKALSAASIYCHENRASFPEGFGNHKNGAELLQLIRQHLENNFGTSAYQRLVEHIDRIESFSEGMTGMSKKRWDRLNRLLDGKRMLRRMQLFGSSFTDRRGDLARHIRINGKIDSEFFLILESFKGTTRSR